MRATDAKNKIAKATNQLENPFFHPFLASNLIPQTSMLKQKVVTTAHRAQKKEHQRQTTHFIPV